MKQDFLTLGALETRLKLIKIRQTSSVSEPIKHETAPVFVVCDSH